MNGISALRRQEMISCPQVRIEGEDGHLQTGKMALPNMVLPHPNLGDPRTLRNKRLLFKPPVDGVLLRWYHSHYSYLPIKEAILVHLREKKKRI